MNQLAARRQPLPAGHDELLSALDNLTQTLDATPEAAGFALARLRAEAVRTARRLARQQARLTELERLAVTDELTGVLNRRGFVEQLEQSLAAAQRYDERGVLVYVDLDGFKPVNDTFGHEAGDRVLRYVGRLLQAHTRRSDVIGRLGGDEFAVLLTRSPWEAGLDRAEALERLVNRAIVTIERTAIPVRASLGIQAYGPGDTAAALLAKADEAMYRAKRVRAEASVPSMNA